MKIMTAPQSEREPNSGSIGRESYVLLGGAVLVSWLAVVLLLWPLHGVLLGWDEVDYFNAAKAGVWANAVDRGSLSPRDFVRFAAAKRAGRTPEVPPGYDERRDPLILRHCHPPFIIYLTAGPLSLLNSTDEHLVRSSQLLGALALICALLFSYLSIAAPARWPGVLAVLLFGAGLSYLAFYSLSCHGWEAVWMTTTAALLSRWLSNGEKAVGVLVCLSLALALITLEMGLVGWVGALLCLLIWKPLSTRDAKGAHTRRRSAIFDRLRYALVGTILMSLFVMVLWPGSVFKISIIKTPLILLYRFLLGQDYSRTAAPFLTILPLFILILLSCAWLFYRRRESVRRWGPFLVFGAIYAVVLITVTPFNLALLYFVPALAPFGCLIGLAVADAASSLTGRLATATILLLVGAAVAWTSWSSGLRDLPYADGNYREDMRWLADHLRGREAFADGAHIYRHYLGDDYHIEPISISADQSEILMRERGEYRRILSEEITGRVLVILLLRTKFIQNEGVTVHTLPDGCQRLDRATIRVYDCAGAATQRSNEVGK